MHFFGDASEKSCGYVISHAEDCTLFQGRKFPVLVDFGPKSCGGFRTKWPEVVLFLAVVGPNMTSFEPKWSGIDTKMADFGLILTQNLDQA